jgi:hypothetical protein
MNARSSFAACLMTVNLIPAALVAGNSKPEVPVIPVVEEGIPDWVPSFRMGYLHQFDADIDNGGSFSVDRASFRLGVSRVFDRDRTVGISLGYGYDDYDFSDLVDEPWSNIHSLRLGLPVRWKIAEDWRLFAVPTVRSTAESGANFSDGVTGGFIGGVSYTFGQNLTIGPGIGVLTQLEDSASVFPILIIQWKITDDLTFETGRGFGSSQGPGLNLVWQASKKWKVTLGSRYEKLRFRLDDTGPAPEGVGEERGIPVYLGANYATGRFSELSLYAGAKFGGSLTLDDESGDRISRSDHDTALFAGIGWKWGF